MTTLVCKNICVWIFKEERKIAWRSLHEHKVAKNKIRYERKLFLTMYSGEKFPLDDYVDNLMNDMKHFLGIIYGIYNHPKATKFELDKTHLSNHDKQCQLMSVYGLDVTKGAQKNHTSFYVSLLKGHCSGTRAEIMYRLLTDFFDLVELYEDICKIIPSTQGFTENCYAQLKALKVMSIAHKHSKKKVPEFRMYIIPGLISFVDIKALYDPNRANPSIHKNIGNYVKKILYNNEVIFILVM